MSEDKVFEGTVVWFSRIKNFGFIKYTIDDIAQKDMFVHFSDITMEGYKTLEKNAKVSFQIGQNAKGDPKAINVVVIK